MKQSIYLKKLKEYERAQKEHKDYLKKKYA